jgi:hypothetical protein
VAAVKPGLQEAEMAHWKRLTDNGGWKIDVNLEQVAYMRHSSSPGTEIVFATGNMVTVRETADEIQQMFVVPSR